MKALWQVLGIHQTAHGTLSTLSENADMRMADQ